MRRSLVVTAILGLIYCQAAATDYYVDNTVSASGNGSLGSPFKTIQEGLNVAVAGDTVHVRGGEEGRVYGEVLVPRNAGTAARPITLKAFAGEKAILTGTLGTRLTVTRDFWIFDGLIIDQNQLPEDAVEITATGITIRNSEIRNGQRAGILIESGASLVTIEDSTIRDFTWLNPREDAHCIAIGGNPEPTDITIQRNTIRHCSGDGIQVFGETGDPISGYAKRVSILNNTFIDGTAERSEETENAIDIKALDGGTIKGNRISGYTNKQSIVLQKGPQNIAIEENVIEDGFTGIDMHQEGGEAFRQLNNTIRRNLIRNMKNYGGFTTYSINLDGVANITIVNNTFAHSDGRAFRFNASITPGVEGGRIQNNLMYNIPVAPSGMENLSGVTVSHNGWFTSPSTGMSDSTDTTGSDPLFGGPEVGMYNLRTDSPAIDAGTPVGLAFIGPAPDLGALEHDPEGDHTAPAAPTGIATED